MSDTNPTDDPRLATMRSALVDIMDDAAIIIPQAPARLWPMLAGIWHVAANATQGGDPDNLPLPPAPVESTDTAEGEARDALAAYDDLLAEKDGLRHQSLGRVHDDVVYLQSRIDNADAHDPDHLRTALRLLDAERATTAGLREEVTNANRGAKSARASRDAVMDTEARYLQERDEARRLLAECVVLSGADTDGNTPETGAVHLWRGAVDEVRRLRADYDESIAEVDARVSEARGEERETWCTAWGRVRELVLHGHASEPMESEQINAVLALLDDHEPDGALESGAHAETMETKS